MANAEDAAEKWGFKNHANIENGENREIREIREPRSWRRKHLDCSRISCISRLSVFLRRGFGQWRLRSCRCWVPPTRWRMFPLSAPPDFIASSRCNNVCARGQTITWPDYCRNRLHSKHLQTQADHAEGSESGWFGMSAYSASAAVPYDAILSGCGFKDRFGMERRDGQEHLGGSAGGAALGPEREQPAQRASYVLFWIPACGGVRPAPHFFADSFPGIKGRQECVWRDAKHRDRDGHAPTWSFRPARTCKPGFRCKPICSAAARSISPMRSPPPTPSASTAP